MKNLRTDIIWNGQLVELDERIFTSIYNRYASHIYALTYEQLKDPDLCRDMVHDVFMSLWNRNPSLASIDSIEHYLVRACKLKICNHIRTTIQHREHEKKLLSRFTEETNDCEDKVYVRELRQQLHKALKTLPEHSQKIFTMSVDEGHNNRKIASSMALSEKTVSFHLVKARKKLRVLLNGFLS